DSEPEDEIVVRHPGRELAPEQDGSGEAAGDERQYRPAADEERPRADVDGLRVRAPARQGGLTPVAARDQRCCRNAREPPRENAQSPMHYGISTLTAGGGPI